YLHICSKGRTRPEISPAQALVGLAFAIARAAAVGRKVRSIAFVVRRLEDQTRKGDASWAHDYPSSLPPTEINQATTLARTLIDELEAVSFPLERRDLLGTGGIEFMAGAIKKHGREGVLAKVRACIRDNIRPAENRIVIGWSWFDDAMQSAKRAG